MAALHALLLTDVVDSTRLTEQLADAAMAALWTAHDRLARDLIGQWRGREIDKTDGMLVLFDEVSDAVGYAFAYHRALVTHGLPIEARAGIHVGWITLRPNPVADVEKGAKPIEVDGIALPTVARVMSIAHGGQTLLSADARQALGVVPHRIESQGHWLLHGIAKPIELFVIGESGAPFETPADTDKAFRVVRQGELWQPVRELRHTLPAERDGFVGRQATLAALVGKIATGTRLICVLGIGGSGKTRLVTRFAWTRLANYPGGVWFCDLSQARGVDGILLAVAQGLEVALGQGDPVTQIGQAIAGRGRCLVILDNFEQVAAFAEETVGRWLERAPLAGFIVTTRGVLGIVGEETLSIPPLDKEDAVQLFLKRAKAARQSYEPNAGDVAAIAQLVKVLDYLPLAIELAAARVRVMSPRALLSRMHDRFEVLLSHAGRRDRQATLRAAFDWSWELLSEPEKAALARLAVFNGGFTLDSASAVLGPGPGSAAPSNIDLVQWLVEKSFVRQVSDERFDLLESVREYAAQHLRAEGRFEGSGPGCEAEARTRHWRFFSALDESAAVAERCVELNNLMAACRAAAASEDSHSATGCLVAAWAALRLVGPYRAGLELALTVLAISALPDGERVWVHWVAGNALDMLGDVDLSRPHVEKGLELAARGHDMSSTARLLIVLGSRQTLDGDLEVASTSLTEAYRLSVSLGDRSLQISTLNVLGRLMEHQAKFREARGFYERALDLSRALGDRRTQGGLLGNLGGLHHAHGELEQARLHYEQAIAMANEVGDRRWEGNARSNLGLLYQEQGRSLEARAQFELALDLANEMGYVRLAYTVLCNLGILLTTEGRLAEAVGHLEKAVQGAVASSDRRSEGQFLGYLAIALAKQGQIESARDRLSRGESLLIASADRLSYALILCDRAEIELLGADTTAAGLAIEQAESIARELECGPESELRRRLTALDALRLVA